MNGIYKGKSGYTWFHGFAMLCSFTGFSRNCLQNLLGSPGPNSLLLLVWGAPLRHLRWRCLLGGLRTNVRVLWRSRDTLANDIWMLIFIDQHVFTLVISIYELTSRKCCDSDMFLNWILQRAISHHHFPDHDFPCLSEPSTAEIHKSMGIMQPNPYNGR